MPRIPLLSGSRLLIVSAPDDAVVLTPPPPPATAIVDVPAAVRDALRFPLDGPSPRPRRDPRRARRRSSSSRPRCRSPAHRSTRGGMRSRRPWTSSRLGVPDEKQTILVAWGLARRPRRKELAALVSPRFARRSTASRRPRRRGRRARRARRARRRAAPRVAGARRDGRRRHRHGSGDRAPRRPGGAARRGRRRGAAGRERGIAAADERLERLAAGARDGARAGRARSGDRPVVHARPTACRRDRLRLPLRPGLAGADRRSPFTRLFRVAAGAGAHAAHPVAAGRRSAPRRLRGTAVGRSRRGAAARRSSSARPRSTGRSTRSASASRGRRRTCRASGRTRCSPRTSASDWRCGCGGRAVPVAAGRHRDPRPPLPPALRTPDAAAVPRVLRGDARNGPDPEAIAAAERRPRADTRALDAYRAGHGCHPLLPFADWAGCRRSRPPRRVLVAGVPRLRRRAPARLRPHPRGRRCAGDGTGVAGGPPRIGFLLAPPISRFGSEARGSSRGTASCALHAAP